MSKKRPHLFFKNPSNSFNGFKYGPRGDSREIENRPPEYYIPKSIDFNNSLQNFNFHLNQRIEGRNLDLGKHIEYVEIIFHGSFDEDTFGKRYKDKFGLSGIKFDSLNTRVIFAILDRDAFQEFINQINLYLQEQDHNNPKYYKIIRFVKEFDLLTTAEMLSKYNLNSSIHYIDLVDEKGVFDYEEIKKSLFSYLQENKANHTWIESNNTIEIENPADGIIKEICDNFDIILSVNSTSTALIRPGLYGDLERDYPFEIEDDNDIPIIGIIDTGISDLTPLKSILVNNGNEYDRFNNNALLDNVGHGTSVGAFAALGTYIARNPKGKVVSDAKLLSIKVLDKPEGDLPVSTIETLIKKAHIEQSVRIFVLTINFSVAKSKDEDFSTYAFTLDKLAYELDIIILISTGNFNTISDEEIAQYPQGFKNEEYNLQVPAESINNLTIGAVGDNFKNSTIGITDKNHPTIYTRSYHLDFENSKKHKVFKPDLVYGGGNYNIDDLLGPYQDGEASLQLLSQPYDDSGTIRFFENKVGTSFSTPLTANLVAKLTKLYPNLNCQSLKALLINSSGVYRNQYSFHAYSESETKYIVGNGIPIEDHLLYSDDNTVIYVLEDSIHPGTEKVGTVKYFRINIPKYLNKHQNSSALLEIKISLCFKVLPIKDNHIGYNPIHMGFNLFKNMTNDELNDSLSAKTKIKNSILIGNSKNWSQDAYYKGRILSNTQKIRYTVSKKVISENDNTFILAINCFYHKLLRKTLVNNSLYNKAHDFSMAISIRENAAKSKLTGRLYNEMEAINTLENISDIELDLEN